MGNDIRYCCHYLGGGTFMGAWGTAIFSDDVACDIRDDYKELIGEGLSNEDATNQLIENYSGTIND